MLYRQFVSKLESRLALFFCLALLQSASSNAIELHGDERLTALSLTTQWRALFHHFDGKFHIEDEHFYLSEVDPTLGSELNAIVAALDAPERNQELFCRFPARFYWVAAKLNRHFEIPTQCTDLLHFLDNVPADNVTLVYASENLVSASSMMGHVLLKLSGKHGTQDRPREHAISFFTQIDDINLPRLMYESFISGKQGFLSLTPYSQTISKYTLQEQRNVWEYQLGFDDNESYLLRLHLWELGTTRLTYYFDAYNCATFTQVLTNLASNIEISDNWVTPLDVVKAVTNAELITDTKLYAAPEWKLQMLTPLLSSSEAKRAIDLVIDETYKNIDLPTNDQQYLSLEYSKAYSDYVVNTGSSSAANQARSQGQTIARALIDARQDRLLDLSLYKSPQLIPNDSQIETGIEMSDSSWESSFRFLPAAITLNDDSRQFFGSRSLKLFEIDIRGKDKNSALKLNQFTLYEVEYLKPRLSATGGISGRLSTGVTQHYGEDLNRKSAIYIEAGAGITVQNHQNVSLFALGGGGLGYAQNESYAYPFVTTGALIEAVFDSKLNLQIRCDYNQLNQRSYVCNQSAIHTFRITPTNSLRFRFGKQQEADSKREFWSANYVHYF